MTNLECHSRLVIFLINQKWCIGRETMDRKNALVIYTAGTFGQIFIICFAGFLLRGIGVKVDYTTALGMLAIVAGGISSALWGAVVTIKYRKSTIKEIFIDFFNVKQEWSAYLLVAMFLFLDFCYVLFGGKLEISSWYLPVVLFIKAIAFGGIEEIGWRYTFQPILEERLNYIASTLITFVLWGIWHFMYFYIEGSFDQVQAVDFLLGLLTSCFLLSALYNKTKSLWICVMTHALINVLSQISFGGNDGVVLVCRGIIIVIAIVISAKAKQHEEITVQKEAKN